MTAVTMPKLGLTMVEGTVVRWLKQPGEQVHRGEPLLEVVTEKINSEVVAPSDGILAELAAPEGATLPVGALLARIDDPGEAPAEAPAKRPAERPAATAGEGFVPASPYARSLARARGVDLGALSPSGPRRMVVARDLPQAPVRVPAEAPPAGGRSEPLSPIRQAIARRMAASASTIPHVTLQTEAAADGLLELKAELNGALPQERQLTLSDLAVAVVARALREFPYVNASLDGDQVTCWEEVHVGLAVALESGLIVPVIRNAGRLSLSQIADRRRDLVSRARSGELGIDEVTGGTFTVSNLGTYGIDGFTPIINPPEAAILGIGRVIERPVRQCGEWVERRFLTLSLSFDHRLMDGAQAAAFLQRVAGLIDRPVQLLL